MEYRPKILIVDDEELSQEFLRFFLAKKFEVYTCGSVQTFYNLLNHIKFDLIIMDIFLRDSKDGIQLTKEIKEKPEYRDTPIFIVTAQNTTRDRNASKAAGAEMFLTKPLDGKYLLGCISDTLKKEVYSV